MKQLGPLILLTMLATILKLFGCSGQIDKDNKENSKDSLDEQISKSIEDFKNRPIHKSLTEQVINNTSDDELLQVVFDNLSAKQSEDKKEYETVMSWNKSRQAIYFIWLLESEVNNGGFNQFYSNSSGQFYKFLPYALRLVGATKFSNLTDRANKTYKKENDKINKHQDGTLEGFSKSYDDNPLNKYDSEFYELYKTENLEKLQVEFIRKNQQEFIDK